MCSAIHPLADGWSRAALDQKRVRRVDDVVVERSATTGCVASAIKQGAFDLEIALFCVGVGSVDNEEVLQEQISQWMIAVLVQRPCCVYVQAVSEREIGVQSCSVRSQVAVTQVKAIFGVVQI